jgi:hypothetical protein
MLNTELREGKQHCQNGTPEFLEHILTVTAQLAMKEPVLFRFDGGNDSKDILKVLEASGHFYIVKRNIRMLYAVFQLNSGSSPLLKDFLPYFEGCFYASFPWLLLICMGLYGFRCVLSIRVWKRCNFFYVNIKCMLYTFYNEVFKEAL